MDSHHPRFLMNLLAGQWPEQGTLEALPDPLPLLQRGFMPALLTLTTPEAVLRWWEGYVATYLERDLRQMSQVESLVDFRRVMALLVLRTGQLVNQSDVARDAGLSQPTIHRYLNLLEATHLFERVPAYLVSHTTRLLKSPRAFGPMWGWRSSWPATTALMSWPAHASWAPSSKH